MRFKHMYSSTFIWPAVLLYVSFFIIPNFIGMVMSFTDWSSYQPKHPSFIGLVNFRDLFDSSIFITSVKNTLFFMVFTTFFKIGIGYLLAILLNRQLKLTSVYRTIIFSPYVINPVVVAIIFRSLYQPEYGPINSFLRGLGLGFLTQNWLTDLHIAMASISLMDVWMGVGVTMIIFFTGLQSVPHEYYEAATIDGAGVLDRFKHITFPLTLHALLINMILCLVGGAKVFGQVYGLTNGGPADGTQVFGTFIFKSFSQGLFGYSAAAGVLFTIAVSIISFVLLKTFKRWEVGY